LVAVSDFVIASEESSFGFTETKIGFVPAIVSVFLTKKIGEGKAKELLLTAEIFDAKKAQEIGLITEVCKQESLLERTEEFINHLLANNSSHAMNATKTLLSKISNLSFDDALKLAAETNAKVRSSEDCKKGIAAFLEKKKVLWN
ncbi:MAG: enoyl-CoA hydratase-related protein, partial [Cytophagales bacterium]